MANLMRLVVSNYNELLESNKDPTVDTWFLMGSPGPVLGILTAYLIFVLKLGPKMMANRPAFELKTVLILYNAFQVIFSIWLCNLIFENDFFKTIMAKECNNDYKSPNPQTALTFSTAAWWYFFAKIIEFFDTIFFVLRKKQDHVTFLHVYHHTNTVLFSWIYLKLLPGDQGIVMGVLNSLVHILMYSYYLIAALGPDYRKYLWWKKYLTTIQLVQFVIILCYLIYLLAIDCKLPKVLTYFFAIEITFFLYLFGDFYRKAYRTKTA